MYMLNDLVEAGVGRRQHGRVAVCSVDGEALGATHAL